MGSDLPSVTRSGTTVIARSFAFGKRFARWNRAFLIVCFRVFDVAARHSGQQTSMSGEMTI